MGKALQTFVKLASADVQATPADCNADGHYDEWNHTPVTTGRPHISAAEPQSLLRARGFYRERLILGNMKQK
jgi:hypothetical protein